MSFRKRRELLQLVLQNEAAILALLSGLSMADVELMEIALSVLCDAIQAKPSHATCFAANGFPILADMLKRLTNFGTVFFLSTARFSTNNDSLFLQITKRPRARPNPLLNVLDSASLLQRQRSLPC